MFFLHEPLPEDVAGFLAPLDRSPLSYPTRGMTEGPAPSGYVVDHNRTLLGHGPDAFARAQEALRQWRPFDFPWIAISPENAPLSVGMVVAVKAHHYGFWSVNANRIIYLVDEPDRFGFAYGTLEQHAERGEERFLVERDRSTDEVWYDLLAYSRPAHPLARLGYPLVRHLQRKFGRDSLAAMRRAVANGSP